MKGPAMVVVVGVFAIVSMMGMSLTVGLLVERSTLAVQRECWTTCKAWGEDGGLASPVGGPLKCVCGVAFDPTAKVEAPTRQQPSVCISSVAVIAPPPGGVPVDAADICGGGRIPGKPEVRDGLLVVTCTCPP